MVAAQVGMVPQLAHHAAVTGDNNLHRRLRLHVQDAVVVTTFFSHFFVIASSLTRHGAPCRARTLDTKRPW